MAVRFDAATDYLNRTASAPAQYPLTVTFWLYITTDRNAYGTLFLIANSGGTSFISFNLSSSGTNLQISVNGNTTNGSNLATGTWYHIACVIASATSQKVYLDGVLDINKTSTSTTFTAAQFFMGSDTVGFLNGRLADVKIFERELTAEEIKHEMSDIDPQLYPAWGFYPTDAGASERVLDYSGNGRNLTANGTLTDEAGPPVWAHSDTSSLWQVAVSAAGAQTITDALYADADAFGADALKFSITDAKFTDGDALGADAIELSIADARLTDADSFGADTLKLSIADARLIDADVFGADTLGLKIIDSLLADDDTFGADALTLGVSDALLTDGDAFGADTLTLSIADARLTEADWFGSDSLSAGGSVQTITDALYADADAFGADSLTLSVADGQLTDADSFGSDRLMLTIVDGEYAEGDGFGGDSLWLATATDSERICAVLAEARLSVVAAEPRMIVVAGEDRIESIPAEYRLCSILAEPRTLSVD